MNSILERAGEMYKPVRSIFILVIGIMVVFIAGCAEQEPPTYKEGRAIAAENIELVKKIDGLNDQIRALNRQHELEIKQLQEALTKMTEDKNFWMTKAQSNIKDQVQYILGPVLDNNQKLRDENKQLKTQIEKLQMNSVEPENSTDNQSTEVPDESMEQ